MSRIDYSKWDNIDCSSSEDEEEESSAPRVTRLDAPSRITKTADGELVVEPQQEQPKPAQPKLSQPKVVPAKQPTPAIQNWMENGSEVKTKDGLTLYWSQDRYSVCLRLALPSVDITGKDIQLQLKGVLPFADRNSAVGNEGNVASMKLSCKGSVLLEGDFPHPIHATEDADEDGNDDWEIDRVLEHDNQRVSYWVLTLQKATPMEGLVIWWRHPLKQFPEIEAKQANPNQKKQAFQTAWEEAHRQFRENKREKQTIPT